MTSIYVWTLATVVFLLELAMVGVLATAAWLLADRGWTGWLAAIGTATVVVALWALFASPMPVVDVAVLKLVVKVVLFVAASLAIWSVMHRADLAVWFAAVAVVVNLAAIVPPYSNYGGFDVPA
ncbi:DUF2568 domain-containing protein [Gordonia phthalatica]|uniref:DUF2568 domain-containing protein n=1 Tax=Gordonia phthalatica TaxID=1136941 RepID=A0A0N9NEV1_9ACTN|nr:DUF2568 domain-containing protein [Gordonia phthalatica]ALG84130.1 hypothetical protein ACH46_05940 [Gordonia phthalatica]